MAHIQTAHLKLWKPQNLTLDKVNSQKMFIDNINAMEDFAKVTMQKLHQPVQTLADLRNIDTSDTTMLTTGMLIMVNENGMYSFNRSHSGDDDSNMIIKPNVGSGRWVAVAIRDIFPHSIQVNTSEELDTYLMDMISSMSDISVRHIVVNATTPFPPFGGGTIHMTIYKVNNAYVVVEARVYYSTPNVVLQFTRSRYSNTWGNWHKLPYLDSNGKIPLDQLPQSVLPASIE